MKIMDFGVFAELEPGLTTFTSGEISWTRKMSPQKNIQGR